MICEVYPIYSNSCFGCKKHFVFFNIILRVQFKTNAYCTIPQFYMIIGLRNKFGWMLITKPFDSRQFGNYLQVKQPYAFIVHCNMHSNSKNAAVHRKYFQFLKSTKNRFFIPTMKVCSCVIESWIIKSVVIKTTRRTVVFHVRRLVDFLPSGLTRSDGSSRSDHFRGFDIFRCIFKRVNFTWRSTWFPCYIIYQKK